MTKKEVPQINENTGISVDYWNEFSRKLNFFDKNNIKGLKQNLKENPIKYYEVFFPSSIYENVVNSENEERVKELNNLVTIINDFANIDDLEYQCNLIICFNSAKELIYG